MSLNYLCCVDGNDRQMALLVEHSFLKRKEKKLKAKKYGKSCYYKDSIPLVKR